MALAETITVIFFFIISIGSLYISYKRNAVMWAIIATILFVVGINVSMTVPFVSVDGVSTGSPSNIALAGLNLIFAFVSLTRSAYLAIQGLKG